MSGMQRQYKDLVAYLLNRHGFSSLKIELEMGLDVIDFTVMANQKATISVKRCKKITRILCKAVGYTGMQTAIAVEKPGYFLEKIKNEK